MAPESFNLAEESMEVQCGPVAGGLRAGRGAIAGGSRAGRGPMAFLSKNNGNTIFKGFKMVLPSSPVRLVL